MPGKVTKKSKSQKPQVQDLKKKVKNTEKFDKKKNLKKEEELKKKQEEELKKKQEEELKKKQEEELKKQQEASSSESSSDSDSSSSESETEVAATVAVTETAESESSSSDSSSSESSSESEEETVAMPKVDKAKVEEDAESSSDSSSSDSSSESEEETAKADVKEAASDSSSSDSSSSDSSSSEEESDEEMETKAAPSKKRAAEETEEKENKVAKTEDTESKTIFVGNLSWGVDENMLREHFADCGEIEGARVITDRDSNRSKGYGYVDFSSSEAAKKALEKVGSELDGREIRVDLSVNKDVATVRKYGAGGRPERPKVENPPSSTLFVGNLSFRTNDSTLRAYFSEVAKVASVRIPTDKETEKVKGFGYVQFADIEEAKKALKACEASCELDGRQLRVNFAAERPNREGFGGNREGFGGNRGGRNGGNRGGSNRFQSRPSRDAPRNNKITFD